MRRIRPLNAGLVVVGLLALVLAAPRVLLGQSWSTVAAGSPADAARSAGQVATGQVATGTPVAARPAPQAAPPDYDLNFTLPSLGKSGCMVCHGDRNLVRLKGNMLVSYWVDDSVLQHSAHANIQCTACHVDFAFTSPHGSSGDDWKRTASLACKNCHETEFEAYGKGVHTISLAPGQKPDAVSAAKPLCGDCHGGHDIATLKDNPKGQGQLHANAYQVCGRCHTGEWDTYSDYYHGGAYRQGASDAPACWQCHGAHDIYPSNDRRSLAYRDKLPDTCGQCHPTANATYVTYAGFVHRRAAQVQKNPVYSFYAKARGTVAGVFESIGSVF